MRTCYILLAATLIVATTAQCNITISEGASWEADFTSALTSVTDGQTICFADAGSYSGTCAFSSNSVAYTIDFQGATVDCGDAGHFLYHYTGNVTLTGGTIANAGTSTYSAVYSTSSTAWFTFTYMTFSSCGGNGAVYMENMMAENCAFNDNTGSSAVVYVFGYGTLTSCTFTDNTAGLGVVTTSIASNAQVYVYDSTFTRNTETAVKWPTEVHDSTFIDNYGDSGVGISASDPVTITGCTFTGNSGTSFGGAVSGDVGVEIDSCVFEGNTGSYGGAVNADGVTLTNCVCRDNVATSSGGCLAMLFGDGPIVVTDSVFERNEADNGGGAIDVFGSNNGEVVSVSGCNFSKNAIANPGYFATDGQVYVEYLDSVDVSDCLFTGDDSPTALYIGAVDTTTTLTDVDISDGAMGLWMEDASATVTRLSVRGCNSEEAGVYLYDVSLDSSDTCIAENVGEEYGGVYCEDVTWDMNGSTDVRGNADDSGAADIYDDGGNTFNDKTSVNVCGDVPVVPKGEGSGVGGLAPQFAAVAAAAAAVCVFA